MYTPNKYEVFIEKMSEKTNKYLVTLNTVDFPEAGFRINKIIKKKLGLKDTVCFLPIKEEHKLLIGKSLPFEGAVTFECIADDKQTICCGDFIKDLLRDFEIYEKFSFLYLERITILEEKGNVYAEIRVPTQEELHVDEIEEDEDELWSEEDDMRS